MKSQVPRSVPDFWVATAITLAVVVGVLGSILLAQQDQPLQFGSGPEQAQLTRTPKPATPTPTQTRVLTPKEQTGASNPMPVMATAPSSGTSSPGRFSTPTPTLIPLPTMLAEHE